MIGARPAPSLRPGLVGRGGETLRIGESVIRQVARARCPGNVLSIFLRQAFCEHRVRLRQRVHIRRRENEAAVRAYCAMSPDDFEGINARQRWANWRVIPRNLDGRLRAGAVTAIDLCCGVGHSTEVLAFYLAPGSQILGLEYTPQFVAAARARDFRDENGDLAQVRFRVQSVLETFRETDGSAVADGSVDLVTSCGAVGCHFDRKATGSLLDEVRRVLARGGLALIDSGPDGTTPDELIALARLRGFAVLHQARSCVFDRFIQLCLRRGV
jgi:SAM-dependent methyltransferase